MVGSIKVNAPQGQKICNNDDCLMGRFQNPESNLFSIPKTNTCQKPNAMSTFRPDPRSGIKYDMSQTDIKTDAGPMKVHLQQTEVNYSSDPPQPLPPPPKFKYFSGGPPKYMFVDEIWRMHVEEEQAYYRDRLKTLIRIRKKNEREQLKKPHLMLLNMVGPDWFEELSPKQLNAINCLKSCLLKDLKMKTFNNTQECVATLGLVLRPHHINIKTAIKYCNKDPVEFLLILYQLIDPERITYSLNDRLLLSAVVHLTMEYTLQELHVRIPSPPKFKPEEESSEKPKKKNIKYKSPYLVPYTFQPAPRKFSGVYKNKHLQRPESPYFQYKKKLNFRQLFMKCAIHDEQLDEEIEEETKAAQLKYSELFGCDPSPRLQKPFVFKKKKIEFVRKVKKSSVEVVEEMVEEEEDYDYCTCVEEELETMMDCACQMSDSSNEFICTCEPTKVEIEDLCTCLTGSEIELCTCGQKEDRDVCCGDQKSVVRQQQNQCCQGTTNRGRGDMDDMCSCCSKKKPSTSYTNDNPTTTCKTCHKSCAKTFEDFSKIKRYQDFVKQKLLVQTMLDRKERFWIGGVTMTRDGPVYQIMSVLPADLAKLCGCKSNRKGDKPPTYMVCGKKIPSPVITRLQYCNCKDKPPKPVCKSCQNCRRCLRKRKEYDDYAKRQSAIKAMLDRKERYWIGGVTMTPEDGPVYQVMGIIQEDTTKLCICNETPQKKKASCTCGGDDEPEPEEEPDLSRPRYCGCTEKPPKPSCCKKCRKCKKCRLKRKEYNEYLKRESAIQNLLDRKERFWLGGVTMTRKGPVYQIMSVMSENAENSCLYCDYEFMESEQDYDCCCQVTVGKKKNKAPNSRYCQEEPSISVQTKEQCCCKAKNDENDHHLSNNTDCGNNEPSIDSQQKDGCSQVKRGKKSGKIASNLCYGKKKPLNKCPCGCCDDPNEGENGDFGQPKYCDCIEKPEKPTCNVCKKCRCAKTFAKYAKIQLYEAFAKRKLAIQSMLERDERFCISGVSMTPDGPVYQITGLQPVHKETCECHKFMEYIERKIAVHKMVSLKDNYVISGVSMTPNGPVYQISGTKQPEPCVCPTFLEKKKPPPQLPKTGVKYAIEGVRETDDGNVFVLSGALKHDCECMKFLSEFENKHMTCTELYEKYLEQMRKKVDEFVKEMEEKENEDEVFCQRCQEGGEEKAEQKSLQIDQEESQLSGSKQTQAGSIQPRLSLISQETDGIHQLEFESYQQSVSKSFSTNQTEEQSFTCTCIPIEPIEIICECAPSKKKEPICECPYEVEEEEEEITGPCYCEEVEEEEECETFKRFYIFDKIPCDRHKQMEIIKTALVVLAEDGFPLARLPDCYKLPHFKLWMQWRCGKFWTQEEKRKIVAVSKSIWKHTDVCDRRIKWPKLNISKEKAEKMTWIDAKYCRNIVSKCIQGFYRNIREGNVDFGREFFPTTFSYTFPTNGFRDCYFAYTPAKEEESLAIRIWKPYEIKDFSTRKSCL